MKCPCNCGREVKLGNTWGARGCALRAISPKERAARGREVMARYSLAQRREWSSKGGRASMLERWSAMLEQWQNRTPREALHTAYWRGYGSGYTAGQKHRRKGRAKETEAA